MMPSGQYYIGDLCYVMTDSEWDEYCSLTIVDHDVVDGEFSFKDGRRFATYRTKWGDGLYRSNISSKHLVDSGTIGCFRIEDIRAEKYKDIESLGAIVTFDRSFYTREEDGKIIFGMVIIDTASDNYVDEDEESYAD